MGPLLNSMSLVLEEFYNQLSVVGVSSMTGDGVDDFFEAVEAKRVEFEKDYRPELERRRADAEEQKNQVREQEVSRMMSDMQVSSKAKGTGKYAAAKDEPETISDMEDAENEDDEDYQGEAAENQDEEAEANDTAFEEALKARYEEALREGKGAASAQSAANYIRQSQR